MSEQTVNDYEEIRRPNVFTMLFDPTENFKRIKKRPQWFVALIIVTLVSLIGASIMVNIMDFEAIFQEQGVTLSEAEMNLVIITSNVTMFGAALLAPTIGVLIISLIYLLISRLLQSPVTFKQLFSMLIHVNIIGALSSIVNGLGHSFMKQSNPEVLLTSLQSIVRADGVAGAILGSIEIFSIWQLIVTAIGLQIVAKFSKKAAWLTVIIFFLIGVAFTVISVAINSVTGAL